MMLPTHALLGLLAALPLAAVAPGSAEPVLVAGLLGGVVPDADMYAGHRKTLHFPVYGTAAALAVAGVAAVWWTPVTAAATAFFLGMALHSLSDAFGGGLELRPWRATSERAVFDHHRGAWIAPRRWVRYDGAPEDLVLSLALGLPLLVFLGDPLRVVVGASLGVAIVYTAIRRSLPAVAERFIDGGFLGSLRGQLVARLPARYRDGGGPTTEGRDSAASDGP